MRFPISPERSPVPVVAAALVGTAAGIAIGAAFADNKAPAHHPSRAFGTVECTQNLPVVGIWVSTDEGKGWADWRAIGGSTSTAEYNRLLPGPADYTVHVRCGGTPDEWQTQDYSFKPVPSGKEQDFLCNLSNDARSKAIGHGVCVLISKD